MDHGRMADLARASREGDQHSFRILVESLSRPLLALAYRYTLDWEIARDLCQETWIKIHEQFQRYDPARSFWNWLLTIHRHGCLSYLRQRAARPDFHLDQDDPLVLQLPEPTADPLAVAQQHDFGERLRQAVILLPPRQQTVFTRVDLEQADQAEVARDLGMKFSTLRTTLHFARKRLAELMFEEEVES